MFELATNTNSVQMIDFGRDGKVLFQLPVLGAKGVPMGITSAFSLFYDRFKTGQTLTGAEVASAWNLLIQTLADAYPEATRQLARLDEDNVAHVVKHWVSESGKLGGEVPGA